MSTHLATLRRLPAVPPRERIERLRDGVMVGDKQRKSRRRDVIPASAEQLRHARQLAIKRAKLEAELDRVHVERLRVVVELRALGVSQGELAELLGVTKGRVQQMQTEARERGIQPPDVAPE